MTYTASPFDALTADIGIKSWALHAAKDGKRMGYYLYLSSNPDVLKDSIGMGVKVDIMGAICTSPDEAIATGYLEYSRECKRKCSRILPPRKIDKNTKLEELPAEDILKELGL